jgi:DNA-binding transcriptional MerR regulator
MSEWLTRSEAAAVLGVCSRTVHTYARKELLRTSKDARDGRTTLYLASDVRKLKTRRPAPVRGRP